MATELLSDKQAFSQMGIQASVDSQLWKKIVSLPQKLFIWADLLAHFGMATFEILV